MYCRYSANSTLKPLNGTAVQAGQKAFDDGPGFAVRACRGAPRPPDRGTGVRAAPAAIAYIPLFGHRHGLEQALDDGVGVDALRLGVEVRHDAVAQDRLRQRLDVLDRHVVAAVHQRARLAAADQRLRRAQPGAPLHPFLDEIRRAGPAGPRRIDQTHGIARDLLGDHHLPRELLELQDVGPAQHARRRRPARRRSSASRPPPRRLRSGT